MIGNDSMADIFHNEASWHDNKLKDLKSKNPNFMEPHRAKDDSTHKSELIKFDNNQQWSLEKGEVLDFKDNKTSIKRKSTSDAKTAKAKEKRQNQQFDQKHGKNKNEIGVEQGATRDSGNSERGHERHFIEFDDKSKQNMKDMANKNLDTLKRMRRIKDMKGKKLP